MSQCDCLKILVETHGILFIPDEKFMVVIFYSNSDKMELMELTLRNASNNF